MKKTINEAIVAVLKETDKPLSATEIYDLIIKKQYYSFKAKNPIAIINSTIRKRCEGYKAAINFQFKKSNHRFYSLVSKS